MPQSYFVDMTKVQVIESLDGLRAAVAAATAARIVALDAEGINFGEANARVTVSQVPRSSEFRSCCWWRACCGL